MQVPTGQGPLLGGGLLPTFCPKWDKRYSGGGGSRRPLRAQYGLVDTARCEQEIF